MDPVTQAALGVGAAQALSNKKQALGVITVLGAIAGMAPDLDVLIRSRTDPLLFLEYHRQFTHSLIFIPVGGILCGLILYYLFTRKRGFSLRQTCFYTTVAYASHALLDACTTYGTMLFWPFSDARIAWNNVSVVDPLVTLPMLFLLALTLLRKNTWFARAAMLWLFAYLSLGVLQRDRAVDFGAELAAKSQHECLSLEAKPSIGNILLWKVVCETATHYRVDAVRTGMSLMHYPGDSIAKLNIEHDFPWLNPDSQQAKDLQRFRWFSNGYIAKDPHHDNRVTDIRYSMLPNEVRGLWSIELVPNGGMDQHVFYHTSRERTDRVLTTFKEMLFPK